jgi:hypothetical protein
MGRRAAFGVRRTAQRLFVLFALFFVVRPDAGCTQDVTFDRDAYYRAVQYCRGDVPRPIALSPDRQVLCFRGVIPANLDVNLAKDLKQDGLFVVQSPGGNAGPAVELSNIVRDRHATVVVYDYCNSACAVILLIASYQTYVLKGTLVTWHYPQSGDPSHPFCTFLTAPRDGEPRKLQLGPCRGGERGVYGYWPALDHFFSERMVDPYDVPPDSLYVRRIVSHRYAERGFYSDILWTLHPRQFPQLFKTKVVYEAYPESQEEVDQMLERLHLRGVRVIYDP